MSILLKGAIQMSVLALVLSGRTGRAIALITAFWLAPHISAEEGLIINLRSVRTHQEVKDADDLVIEKSYKTSRGEVIIRLVKERGKITGAVAKLGSTIIARADSIHIPRWRGGRGDSVSPKRY
jgi:hypothetical protein